MVYKLTIPPNMKVTLYEDYAEASQHAKRDSAYLYGVQLVKVVFPFNEVHSNCEPITVVCISYYKTEVDGPYRWGWVAMENDAKEIFGGTLVDFGAIPGYWYWLVLNPELPQEAHYQIEA